MNKNITVAKYLDVEEMKGTAYYKGCKLVETQPIDEKWTLLFLQIPFPVGGTYREIVSNETLLDVRGL